MKKLIQISFPILLVLLLVQGCTNKKDGFVYRQFHNTTARYNGYFYSKEAMREADIELGKKQKDDYDNVLPVYFYGAEEDAQVVFPLMERSIEKSSRVIDRHKIEGSSKNAKKIKHPELNKWIDENYMLIGQAHFYKRNYFKAEEMFLFVTRKYKEPEVQVEGNIWLARCYMANNDMQSANNAMLKAIQVKGVEDEEKKAELHLVYADYFIKMEMWKEAAAQIEYALPLIKRKKDRARPTFILAQLMERQNKSQEAINLYNTVLKLKPKYEMAFYAKISQALAFDRKAGNAEKIKETLFKMLKDEKNIEYQDQIYYALADLELEERHRDIGVDYLETSLDVSVGNVKQKTKGFIRLADIYFEERNYPLAQAYYDSTFKNLEETHPRYQDVKNKAESLTELVGYLNTIAGTDSLMKLCELDEETLFKKVSKIRRQMVEEEEERRYAAELAAASQTTTDEGVGQFWPYNNQLRESGKESFLSYWGDRPLEDNWRRKNKLQQAFGDGEEEVIEEQVVEAVTEVQDVIPSVEELIAQLPCDEASQKQGQSDVASAYYNSGVIYREKLTDLDNAIEQWEVLVTRFDDSEFHPTAFYLLYRTYLYRETNEGYSNPFCGTCNSVYWANMILDRYPGTEWAQLVENPDYQDFAELKKAEESKEYERIIGLYYQRQYLEVILQTSEKITNEPENHLLCKYKLLKAQSIGYMDGMTGLRSNYLEALKEISTVCKGSEEAAFADGLLKKLSEELKAAEDVKEVEETTEETPETPASESLFAYDAAARHYFMVVVPLGSGDINAMKAEISDFNTANFKSLALKVSSNMLDKDHQVILIKTFNKISDAEGYFKAIAANTMFAPYIEQGFPYSLISKENYVTLFKNKQIDAYQNFFSTSYSLEQ